MDTGIHWWTQNMSYQFTDNTVKINVKVEKKRPKKSVQRIHIIPPAKRSVGGYIWRDGVRAPPIFIEISLTLVMGRHVRLLLPRVWSKTMAHQFVECLVCTLGNTSIQNYHMLQRFTVTITWRGTFRGDQSIKIMQLVTPACLWNFMLLTPKVEPSSVLFILSFLKMS